MYRILTSLLTFFLLAATLSASAQAPAVYRDGVLTVPQGAIIDDGAVQLYRDIELTENDEGLFEVTASQEAQLADVESVQVRTEQVDPGQVEVVVSGRKSSACVELLEPAISFRDNTFTVALGETEQTAEVCILIVPHFEISFPLDVSDLDSGEYLVSVNGVEAQFTL